jgi:hypothetical protein
VGEPQIAKAFEDSHQANFLRKPFLWSFATVSIYAGLEDLLNMKDSATKTSNQLKGEASRRRPAV